MATGVLVGVLTRSWRSREREIEDERRTRESERGSRGRVVMPESSRASGEGGARRQAGGGRRASGTRPRLLGRVEKMTGSWAAQ